VLVCALMVLVSVSEIGSGIANLVFLGSDRFVDAGAIASGALSVAGAGVLWFRRRWPVRVSIALALLCVVHVLVEGRLGGFAVGFALALYVVAATRPQRIGWMVLGGASVAVVSTLVVWGAPNEVPSDAGAQPRSGVVVTDVRSDERVPSSTVPSDGASFLVLGLIAMAVGANVRGRRLHVRGLVERHEQLVEAGEQHAKLAAAAEQTRIAREMHDVVAHGLTVMIALSDGARVAVRRSPDDAEQALDLLSDAGRAALADMRRMLGVLRGADVPLEPQPGTQDLESLVQQFRAAGLTVHLTTAGPALPSDPALALTVYRVVQESLTNALRHAGPGSRVDVLVRHGARRIGIEVVDDGGGAEPVAEADGDVGIRGRISGKLGERRGVLDAYTDAPVADGTSTPSPGTPVAGAPGGSGTARAAVRGGRGLVGMRERAAVYRGTVSAGPYRAGWRVHVELRTDDVADAPTPEEHP
jgi:signal transduction histidine kinase